MTVKADWGATTADASTVSAPEVDPFDVADSQAMPEGTAERMKPRSFGRGPIDLSTPEPVLREWLGELIRREGNLWECGTTCPLKDSPEGNCTACPLSRANETDGTLDEMHLTHLCRIGAEQERVVMLLKVKQHRGG